MQNLETVKRTKIKDIHKQSNNETDKPPPFKERKKFFQNMTHTSIDANQNRQSEFDYPCFHSSDKTKLIEKWSSNDSNIYLESAISHQNDGFDSSNAETHKIDYPINKKTSERDYPPSKVTNISSQTDKESINSEINTTSLVNPDRIYKVIFLGDSGVGKSSFIQRFCCDRFQASYFQATVGVDYQVKTIEVDDYLVALQLWDTAGQERYRSFVKQYFRKTDGVVFMYDVTNKLSFRNIRNWITLVKENSIDKLNGVLVIIGNKIDLCENNEKRQISTNTGRELSKKYNALFYETSCKTGDGIWEVMIQATRKLQLTEDKEIQRMSLVNKGTKSRKCC